MDFWDKKPVALEELMPLIRENLSQGRSVRFSPRGTSMLPMLRQGIDQVILSPVMGKLRRFDLPFYQRDNGQYVLHRIVKVGDTYTCMGDNQFVKEQGVRPDQIIAVATGFVRGDREHSVEEFSHKCYCRLWYYSRHLRHIWRGGIGWLRRHLK